MIKTAIHYRLLTSLFLCFTSPIFALATDEQESADPIHIYDMPYQFLQKVARYLPISDRDQLALVDKTFYEIERTADWKNRKFVFYDGTPETIINGALFYRFVPNLYMGGCVNLRSLIDLKDKDIRRLDLSHSHVTKAALKNLPKSLTKLSLKGVKGKLALSHLTNLESLCIDETDDIDVLKDLKDLTKLKRLRLSGTNADIPDVEALLPSLQLLQMNSCLLLTRFASFQTCQNLQILSLEYTPILEKYISLLPTTLIDLNLALCPHLKKGHDFQRFTRLLTLNLSWTSMSSRSLKLPETLMKLSMHGCARVNDLDFCTSLQKLRTLGLSSTSIQTAHLNSIPESVVELDISCTLGLIDHSPLRRLNNLQWLYINDNGILTLENLPRQIEALNMSGCKHMRNLELLREFPKLWWIDMSYLDRGVNMALLPDSILHISTFGNICAWPEDLKQLASIHLDYIETNTPVLDQQDFIQEMILSMAGHFNDYTYLSIITHHLKKLTLFLNPRLLETLASDIIPHLPKSIVELEVLEDEGGGHYQIIGRKIPPEIAAHLPNLRSFIHRKQSAERQNPQIDIPIDDQENLVDDLFIEVDTEEEGGDDFFV